MANVRIDVSELNEFFKKASTAGDDFKQEIQTYLDGIGVEFLRVVQDEIKRREVLDTRQLLASFEKGAAENIWELREGNLVLEVGSSTNYAKYVNDGHWTVDPAKGHITLADGTIARFVPGSWNGDRFEYQRGASGGMILKQQWVDGKPYFDSALRIMDKMFPQLLERKMQEWLDKYFS